ncbi:MAG: heat-inducible transcriptional repressor HrcA [Actinomycetota bacterium]|nr:heat-inducible transcriptional repressor HrcA [Actinomycetota bacterium]
MKLNQRKKEILKSIIESFIEKAEPVSSSYIAENINMNLSSATIRKEMSELEEMGFLSHPHTSAGRIPTDQGYRYYVDSILLGGHLIKVNPGSRGLPMNIPVDKNMDFEKILVLATELLFKFTNYLSMIVAPEINKSKFRHIELINFGSNNRYMFILITDSGRVMKASFEIEGGYNDLDLQRVRNILNTELKNKYINEINENLKIKILDNEGSLLFMIKKILKLIKSFKENTNYYNRIFIRGALSILKDPEFIDFNKVKNIIGLLENDYLLMKILKNYSCDEEISVRIGSEIYGQDTCDLSLVSTKYCYDGSSIGSIGIIGPKRMDYLKVINTLSVFRENLTDVLNLKS